VEMVFSEWISRAQTGTDALRTTARREATRIAGLIDRERSTPPTGTDAEALERSRAQKATRVNTLLEELQPHTALLFGPLLPSSFRGSVNPAGASAAGFGVGMTVKPLTSKERPTGSPPTSAANVKYAALNERRESPGGASFYIKGHLLNMELGGPGQWANMVPLSRSGNAQHERQTEAIVKRSVDAAMIVEYEVMPVVSSRSDRAGLITRINASREPEETKRVRRAIVEAEDFVPNMLTIRAHVLDERLQRRGALLNQSIQNAVSRELDRYYLSTTPRPVPVNLSEDDEATIATLPGIGMVLARRIVAARPGGTGRFSSYRQVADLVDGIGEERLRALESAGHVRLFGRG
jgi:hypothetical protein